MPKCTAPTASPEAAAEHSSRAGAPRAVGLCGGRDKPHQRAAGRRAIPRHPRRRLGITPPARSNTLRGASCGAAGCRVSCNASVHHADGIPRRHVSDRREVSGLVAIGQAWLRRCRFAVVQDRPQSEGRGLRPPQGMSLARGALCQRWLAPESRLPLTAWRQVVRQCARAAAQLPARPGMSAPAGAHLARHQPRAAPASQRERPVGPSSSDRGSDHRQSNAAHRGSWRFVSRRLRARSGGRPPVAAVRRRRRTACCSGMTVIRSLSRAASLDEDREVGLEASCARSQWPDRWWNRFFRDWPRCERWCWRRSAVLCRFRCAHFRFADGVGNQNRAERNSCDPRRRSRRSRRGGDLASRLAHRKSARYPISRCVAQACSARLEHHGAGQRVEPAQQQHRDRG